MPLFRSAFVQRTTILLIVGLLALLTIVATTFWLALSIERSSIELLRWRQAALDIVSLRGLLQDVETGQRGFLLTSTEAYLVPYERAREELVTRIDQLDLPTPDARQKVERLREAVSGKLAELAETIELVRAGRMEEALGVVRSGRGKAAMDAARANVDLLLAETNAGSEKRERALERAGSALPWVVGAGAAVILGVMALGWGETRRYLGDLAEARAALTAANTDLEKRVQQRTAALEQANREVERFAYVVSHDLRSPLVNVIGFTSELEQLKDEIFDAEGKPRGLPGRNLAEEFTEATGFIRSSVTRMDALIAAILRIAREGGRQLHPEPLDLRALVATAADGIRHRLDERGGDIVVSGQFPPIEADKLAVEQIVGNLLDNAAKYSDPARAPRIEIVGGEDEQGRVFVAVKDNGLGIAERDRQSVFELFRRVGKADVEGEGIGLSHVQALARRMGGTIDLESTLGEGSTFTLRLPRGAALG